MLIRGQVALENITAANTQKAKQDITENTAKFETIDTMMKSNVKSFN